MKRYHLYVVAAAESFAELCPDDGARSLRPIDTGTHEQQQWLGSNSILKANRYKMLKTATTAHDLHVLYEQQQ